MIQNTAFTITDPRTFDGNPMQVAGRAVSQCEALAEILSGALDPAKRMARNAELERQIIFRQKPNAAQFDDGPQGRLWSEAEEHIEEARKALQRLAKIAGTDPSSA